MISPLDETCPPAVVVKEDTHKDPIISTDNETLASVSDEATTANTVKDEDCPDSRNGDGCE